MAKPLRTLLECIGATIGAGSTTENSSIECIGVLTGVPPSLMSSGATVGQTVWSTGKNWIKFRQSEFESWLVDVPLGSHLLAIEREAVELSISTVPDGVDLVIWDRNDIALIIGQAVMDGILSLEDARNANLIDSPSIPTGDSKADTSDLGVTLFERIRTAGDSLAIASEVNPLTVLDDAGLAGTAFQPALIETRIWLVSGILMGPNGENEKNEWVVLEDPDSNKLELACELSLLQKTPSIERIRHSDQKNEQDILHGLPNLCDERRHQEIEPTGSGKGSLLRWWRLDTSTIEIEHHSILLPCWIVRTPLDGIKIIHGINGEIMSPNGNLTGID